MGFFKFLFRTILSFLAIAIVIIGVLAYMYYTPPPPPSKVVFDIPALAEKNIDEVRLILGKPDDEQLEPKDKSTKSWSNIYHKDGFRFSISFDPASRAISQYRIVIDGKGSYESLEEILRIGNLGDSTPIYTIETDQSDMKRFSYVIIHINK